MTEGGHRQILLLKYEHLVAECRTAYRFAQLASIDMA